MEKIKEIINQVLINRGKSAVKVVDKNTNLRKDLRFDSLDLAELTVRIEAVYDIDVFEDGIINTVGEIIQKINAK